MARTGVHQWRLLAVSRAALVAAATGCTAPAGAHHASSAGNNHADVTTTTAPLVPTTAPAVAPPPVISGGAADAPCHYKPSSAALPTWARDGFGPPYTGWPHVTSTDGNILAVLFTDPPYAPLPPGDPGNKIVWAAKDPPGGGLTVDAHLVGTPEAVEIGEIFLGRSLVNVPRPGCWRLTLRWTLHSSASTETVDIVYKPR